MALLRHHGAAVNVNAPGAGELTLKWTVTLAHHRRAIAVTRQHFSSASSVKIKIALTAAGNKLIRALGQLRVTATNRFTPANQTTITVSKKLTLGR